MENCEWIQRLPLKLLMVAPGMCASFVAIFLLLLRDNRHMHFSDFGAGAVVGVFLGISFLCLLLVKMKKQIANVGRAR